MLGVDNRTLEKLAPSPDWASCLRPMAIETKRYYSCLHTLLPVNGGARENRLRTGLEAFAVGAPVVTQNDWGWHEMIEHDVTDFLGSNDCELAHYTAMPAYDEDLRMQIIHNARKRLVEQHANPDIIWQGWKNAFDGLKKAVA
jgi:glycosyltransferase involved in cell wall biosynthesis